MNKNRLLNAMLFISISCSIMLLAAALLFTITLVHWHIDREFYNNVPIPFLSKVAFIKLTVGLKSATGTQVTKYPATLNNLSYWCLYFIYCQFMLITLLIFSAIREFIAVIRSVKQIQTFVSNNIASFKKIGFCMFIVFILSGFQIVSYKGSLQYGIYLHALPLIISMLSYTLSEIFKEGNELMEENKGTI